MATRTTTHLSPRKLKAEVSAAEILNASIKKVDVYNPEPHTHGLYSNQVNLSIDNPDPSITSISPSNVSTGTAHDILITGTGFVPESEVRLNNGEIKTTYNSRTDVSGAVRSSAIARGGVYSIRISNPSSIYPGKNHYSNIQFLTVNNPVPLLSSISPVNVTAGGEMVPVDCMVPTLWTQPMSRSMA